MYKDGISDREKLVMVSNMQSYSGNSPNDNRFMGLDEFHCANIRKGQRLYAFKPAFFYDKLCKEKPATVDFCWFFDQATFNRLVKDGEFNSREIAEYLQVDYWKDQRTPNSDAVYNDSIFAFELKEDIRVPVGVCLANDQFGNGGAHQCFIPKDMVEQLQDKKLLVFVEDESMIHKGFDNNISKSRRKQIDDSVQDKMDFCDNNNQKHCTISDFAVSAEPHKDIPSLPFNCDHIGIDSTYDTIKNEKIDPSKPITGPRAGDHFVKADEISTSKIVEYEPEINKTEKTHSKKEHERVKDSVLAGKIDFENVKVPLAGLHDLQKYLDHANHAGQSENMLLSDDDFCLQ